MAASIRCRTAWLALACLPVLGACQLSEIKIGSDGSEVTMTGARGAEADSPGPSGHAACRALIVAQAEAWNRGDLEAFAEGYERSDHLVFATVEGTQVGFDDMLARYRRTYPDRAAMGRLTFSGLSFSDLDPEHVAARGVWRLQRAEDEPHGTFLLVFRQRPEGWRIVLDYTTSAGA